MSIAAGLWYRWTPDNAGSVAYEDVGRAVADFESVDVPAGREAARWLRDDALIDHPSTVTYVCLSDERLEGYFALASGSVLLSQGDRKQLGPGQKGYAVMPVQGASLIAWLARHRDADDGTGQVILEYALSVALDVAYLQGTPAAVLDPFDEGSAKIWESYGFKRSQTPGGNDVRMWLPLHPE